MNRICLVAYFSATGTTEKVAKTLAEAIGADLYEIEAKAPYSGNDLDWNDKKSRCVQEWKDKSSRPVIKTPVSEIQPSEITDFSPKPADSKKRFHKNCRQIKGKDF
jgi:flavodoxin